MHPISFFFEFILQNASAARLANNNLSFDENETILKLESLFTLNQTYNKNKGNKFIITNLNVKVPFTPDFDLPSNLI